MNETTTRDEQRARLDQFAQAPLETKGEIVPAATYLPPMERHGAIKVEVTRSAASTRAAISEMAMLLGERGVYRWPVKNRKKGTTDWIEGVSVKGAMALVKAYKNCRVACPLIVDLGSHWRFHAVFVDYENGIEYERSFIQRKSGGTMGDDAARREDMAYQIGLSKAERNVVVNALEIEADILLEECKRSIVDRVGQNVEHYRRIIAERAAERGVELARIEAVAGRPAKDWVAIDMVRIIGMMAAVNDGMATNDETFPKLQQAQPDSQAMVAKSLDQFAAGVVEDDTGTAAGPAAAPAAKAPPPMSGGAAVSDDLLKRQEDLISRLLRMAQDAALTPQERLENLENLSVGLHEMLPGHATFVDTVLNTAAKVATGKLPALAAQKYLTGLVTP